MLLHASPSADDDTAAVLDEVYVALLYQPLHLLILKQVAKHHVPLGAVVQNLQ